MVSFNEKCYQLLKQVPKGKVTTYKELAIALNTKAYRAVGRAMNKNPHAPIVPCHRVINSNGSIGGFAFGVNKKMRMLKEENIEITNNKVNLKRYLYKF